MSDTQQGQGVELKLSELRSIWKIAKSYAHNWGGNFKDNWRGDVDDEINRRKIAVKDATIADLRATIAELRAQLAAAQQWEPLPDRLYQFDKVQGIALTEDGAMLEAIICRDPRWTDTVGIELPKHVRLCQRRTNTPQEGE